MSRTSKRSSELSAKKRELLEALLQKEGVARSTAQKISRRKDAGAPPPLSFAQQRLWFLNQLEPEALSITCPPPYVSRPGGSGGAEQAATRCQAHRTLRNTSRPLTEPPSKIIARHSRSRCNRDIVTCGKRAGGGGSRWC